MKESVSRIRGWLSGQIMIADGCRNTCLYQADLAWKPQHGFGWYCMLLLQALGILLATTPSAAYLSEPGSLLCLQGCDPKSMLPKSQTWTKNSWSFTHFKCWNQGHMKLPWFVEPRPPPNETLPLPPPAPLPTLPPPAPLPTLILPTVPPVPPPAVLVPPPPVTPAATPAPGSALAAPPPGSTPRLIDPWPVVDVWMFRGPTSRSCDSMRCCQILIVDSLLTLLSVWCASNVVGKWGWWFHVIKVLQ